MSWLQGIWWPFRQPSGSRKPRHPFSLPLQLKTKGQSNQVGETRAMCGVWYQGSGRYRPVYTSSLVLPTFVFNFRPARNLCKPKLHSARCRKLSSVELHVSRQQRGRSIALLLSGRAHQTAQTLNGLCTPASPLSISQALRFASYLPVASRPILLHYKVTRCASPPWCLRAVFAFIQVRPV